LKDELHKRMSWLDALKSADVETTGKAEIAEDFTSPFEDEISESLIQGGAKSAKSPNPSPMGSNLTNRFSSGEDTTNRSQDEKKTPSKTKKSRSPEEEEELRSHLAGRFNYAYTEEAAMKCLEWVRSAPEIALDIETYGRNKTDGLLYTKGKVRLKFASSSCTTMVRVGLSTVTLWRTGS
jgi:hypothetical protein